MYLALEIILDELAEFNPVISQKNRPGARFRQFRPYHAGPGEPDPECLYVLDAPENRSDLGNNCPKNLIVIGDAFSGAADTSGILIRISGGVSAAALLQAGQDMFLSYESWYTNMLLAVIDHKPIGAFLEIAAQKLVNPLALLDNTLRAISSAGVFLKSKRGTIWEKISDPGFVLSDFFTSREQRDLSKQAAEKTGRPYVYRPSKDSTHTHVSAHIWIHDRHYGSIGLVDINAPFTDGQLEIIYQINQTLKQYFQNNDMYMRIAENKFNYLDSLLKGADVSVEIVSRCLAGMNWKTGDAFYALVFNCPLEFTAPVEAMSYVKEINSQFPGALVSVYQNHIVMIARPLDYPLDRDKEKQKLERLLKKSGMRCGVSAVFDDFMGIRHYFVQAAFAAECCKTENRRLGFYQDYYKRHILSSLAKPADLPCFCSPEILSLWKSGKEGQRELARTLHHYLLNGRSIALTAESLHVHRNTLIYRLGRLSDLLGENIKELDADQAFYYLMSCLIVQHL